MQLITLKSVSISYDRPLFDSLELTINSGDRICITGPSGGGKTTLLNIILGLVKPDTGGVTTADGIRLAAVFQEDRLIEHLSGVQNISALSSKKVDFLKARSALVELGIDPAELQKPVSEWSGGMRRRAALARAMLSEASLIALDEPFTGLDRQSRRLAAEYINRNIGSAALLLVSHNRRDSLELGCEQLIEL